MATRSIHGVPNPMTAISSSALKITPQIHSCSPISLFPSKTHSTSLFLPSSFLSIKVDQSSRLYSHGVPSELEEDAKFVPLNPEDPSYGPPAILLLGFRVEEADKIQQLLKELDGEFLEVIYCTEDMITGSLWEAVNIKQQSLSKLKIAKSVPRMCFLSGLTGEEMMMFIEAFEDAGLEPAVFAAHVPNSSSKSIQELIEEVMGDHEMLAEKSSDK